MKELRVRLNNIIRTITYSSKFCPITNLYNKLNFLKLTDIYKLELAKIMHQLLNSKLPKSLHALFTKIEAVLYIFTILDRFEKIPSSNLVLTNLVASKF